jgi:Flp pilus assembly protein TadG
MRIMKRFIGDRRGTAAIEFGLVLPVLAGIVIFMPDVTEAAVGAMNMDGAVRAGIQFAMNGSTNTTTIQTYANNNWISKPHGATMNATLACYCDNSLITCGQPCTGVLSTYITVAATATVGGTVISVPLTKTQKVRMQ